VRKRPEALELFMVDSRFIQAVFVHDFELFVTTPCLLCAKETGSFELFMADSRIIRAVFVHDFELFMITSGLLCTKETGISRIVHDQLSQLDFELFMTTPALLCAKETGSSLIVPSHEQKHPEQFESFRSLLHIRDLEL